MTAILFPGQGVQKKGMGKDLFSKYKKLTEECSAILGFSIEEICLHNRDNQLSQTRYLQPVLFFVNMLIFYESQKLLGPPVYFLGHSLGEYNALCAAGVFSLETGMELVKKRAQLMSEVGPGAMVAILGQNRARIEEFLTKGEFLDIDIANLNTASQTVLSGPPERIQYLAQEIGRHGIKAIVLNVSGAFHSRYMEGTAKEYEQFLKKFSFNEPICSVLSNATLDCYGKDNVATLLSKQLFHSVRWEETIVKVLQNGVSTFHEIGSEILSKMVTEIRQQHPVILSPRKNSLLGSVAFKERFGLRHAYIAGSMYRGISSPELVIRMANSKFLSFYGTGGLELSEIEEGIQTIIRHIKPGASFGVNLLSNYMFPEEEMNLVDLLLKHKILIVEASAFLMVTPALAYYAIKGLYYNSAEGRIANSHSIFSKISHPQVAKLFMSPVSAQILQQLLKSGRITLEEAALAKDYPLSTCICVEGDSGGHTNRKPLAPLFTSIARIREEMNQFYNGRHTFFLGAAGGLGDPISVGVSFLLGADFVLTGSVNQCTVEARTSDRAKDLLQAMLPEDTDYSIAGDMFEMGAKIQVLKKGLLFSVRANTLYNLYTIFKDVREIPAAIRDMLEKQFFHLSLEEVAKELGNYYIEKKTGKEKMAALFRWYLRASNSWAISGDRDRIADYQIHTGPSMGAFNLWVKGTPYEEWKKRHVDEIAELILDGASDYINHLIKKSE